MTTRLARQRRERIQNQKIIYEPGVTSEELERRRMAAYPASRKLETEALVTSLEPEREFYDPQSTLYLRIFVGVLVGVATAAVAILFFQDSDTRTAVFLAPTNFPTPSTKTISPTQLPSIRQHTEQPTVTPTYGPSLVAQPTREPSIANYTPTTDPTLAPLASNPSLTPTRQVSSSPTTAPTVFPSLAPSSSSPTLSPTTFKPTLSPTTLEPTLSPTEFTEKPTSRIVSRLNCTAIQRSEEAKKGNFGEKNFKIIEINGRSFCGDTYGPDVKRPNRNAWAPKIGRRDCPQYSYAEGERICDSVGARWCTVEEFILGVGHGTGCGGDSEPIYTLTNCLQNNTGISGKLMFNVGLSTPRTIETHCVTNQSVTSLVRCCGDMEVED